MLWTIGIRAIELQLYCRLPANAMQRQFVLINQFNLTNSVNGSAQIITNWRFRRLVVHMNHSQLIPMEITSTRELNAQAKHRMANQIC